MLEHRRHPTTPPNYYGLPIQGRLHVTPDLKHRGIDRSARVVRSARCRGGAMRTPIGEQSSDFLRQTIDKALQVC
jgi:hypothetical protein